MEKLKPCPFCGGEAVFRGQTYYYIWCKSCLAETRGSENKEEAIEAWNSRADVIDAVELRDL